MSKIKVQKPLAYCQLCDTPENTRKAIFHGDKLSPEEADEFIADCDEFGSGELEPEMVSQVLINGPK